MTTQKTPSKELDTWKCRKGHIGNRYIHGGKSRCRTCRNERARESYLRHQEARNAQHQAYRKKNWERVKEVAYKRYDPIRGKARQAVNNAVHAGKLEKEPCAECGSPKVDFHHTNGYDKENWFTGMWLCRKHHLGLHRELRWKTN